MLTPKTCSDILSWRYATKNFTPGREIPADTWSAIRDTFVMAPSSFGLELWQFLDVQTPAVRQQLREVSWGQAQVTDASRFVVICVRRDVTEEDCDRHIRRMCEVRGGSPDALQPYKEKFFNYYNAKDAFEARSWIDRQSYIAMGYVMFAAAALGVDTCAIEGMEPARYDDILGLNDTPYRAICALALGYRVEGDKYASVPKVRYSDGEVFKTV